MPTVPHDDIIKDFLNDPDAAAAFLNDAIENGSEQEIVAAFETLMRVHDQPLPDQTKLLLPRFFHSLMQHKLALHFQAAR